MSLWPRESQHARPPCPSQTPGVYSDSCPSSRDIWIRRELLGVQFSVTPSLVIVTHIYITTQTMWYTTSLVAQTVNNLPAMQETQVWSLSREDPLEQGNGNPCQHSCLENAMVRGEPSRLQSMRLQRVGHDLGTNITLQLGNITYT